MSADLNWTLVRQLAVSDLAWFAVPPSRPTVETELAPGGKRKVMVYVPPGLHRAMRRAALDYGRSASDLYVEAALAFLALRGVQVDDGARDEGLTSAPPMTMVDIAAAVDRLGQRIDETLGGSAEHVPTPGREKGTKAADAMKSLLAILRASGTAGLSSPELATAMWGAGVTSGATETAKAVLRGAGLVRCEARRWVIDGA